MEVSVHVCWSCARPPENNLLYKAFFLSLPGGFTLATPDLTELANKTDRCLRSPLSLSLYFFMPNDKIKWTNSPIVVIVTVATSTDALSPSFLPPSCQTKLKPTQSSDLYSWLRFTRKATNFCDSSRKASWRWTTFLQQVSSRQSLSLCPSVFLFHLLGQQSLSLSLSLSWHSIIVVVVVIWQTEQLILSFCLSRSLCLSLSTCLIQHQHLCNGTVHCVLSLHTTCNEEDILSLNLALTIAFDCKSVCPSASHLIRQMK